MSLYLWQIELIRRALWQGVAKCLGLYLLQQSSPADVLAAQVCSHAQLKDPSPRLLNASIPCRALAAPPLQRCKVASLHCGIFNALPGHSISCKIGLREMQRLSSHAPSLSWTAEKSLFLFTISCSSHETVLHCVLDVMSGVALAHDHEPIPTTHH